MRAACPRRQHRARCGRCSASEGDGCVACPSGCPRSRAEVVASHHLDLLIRVRQSSHNINGISDNLVATICSQICGGGAAFLANEGLGASHPVGLPICVVVLGSPGWQLLGVASWVVPPAQRCPPCLGLAGDPVLLW